ncbi:class I histocompatibility antigen, F10 alpha chain-like [Phascolarctos cinereus]|uniref:Class I histocompatibility antigen, F10 alpha chain-like n=1 Tax=Phascolarctos cinereus TaxID=38626 RepID=A0A6P5LJV8_PHACI|nr:class I histocompatibility antigen, F10 alpha chain-like [Phascolarctos cinereus]
MQHAMPYLHCPLVKGPSLFNSSYTLKNGKHGKKYWGHKIYHSSFPFSQLAYHSLEMCFTAVGTTKSLLDFTMVSSMDGVQGSFYDKKDQQLVIKEAWVSQALGAHYIEEKRQKLVYSEINFLWALQNWIQSDTKGEDNHTVQFWHDCHLDGDIHVSSHFWYAVDGEAFCGVDEQLKHWVAMKPEAECFRPFWEVIFPYKKIKHYMQEDCVEPLRKVLQYSSIRENVPPDVTVSRQDAPDGRATLFCRATGFYPRSIMLHWEKDGALGVWGQESSSGTLPNADSTFYLQVTLELPLNDPGTGYTCVVQHSELETPGIFPVPGKPTMKRPRAMALSILAIVILIPSCAAAFNTWKKRKTGTTSQGHVEGPLPLPHLLLQ